MLGLKPRTQPVLPNMVGRWWEGRKGEGRWVGVVFIYPGRSICLPMPMSTTTTELGVQCVGRSVSKSTGVQPASMSPMPCLSPNKKIHHRQRSAGEEKRQKLGQSIETQASKVVRMPANLIKLKEKENQEIGGSC